MSKSKSPIKATFVNTHFVDEKYHKQHSQLVHQHMDVLELFYIVEGSGHYLVSNKEYTVQPGSMVICNQGVLHGEAPFQKHNIQSYCCVLKDLCLPDLPPNTLIDDSCPPIVYFAADRPYIEKVLMGIHEYNNQGNSYQHICNLLSNALLNIVYNRLNEEVYQKEQEYKKIDIRNKSNEALIKKIIEYLNQRYMEPLTLEELADVFNMSHYYLSHLFKTETGLSPMKYIVHRKIGEAQNLLMNTDMLIGKICDITGFSDSCHFSSMFKKYIGVTPTQYRQHFRVK
jgi:AraC-like DNA-binding protein